MVPIRDGMGWMEVGEAKVCGNGRREENTKVRYKQNNKDL